MAFLKTDKSKCSRKNLDGIVYILIMVIDGYEVYKIGVTSRETVYERSLEILSSHCSQYRFYPYMKPKRFRKTSNIYEKEKALHNYFEECRYTPEKPFGGSTELFDIDNLEHLLDVYVRVLDGEVLEGTYKRKDDVPDDNEA